MLLAPWPENRVLRRKDHPSGARSKTSMQVPSLVDSFAYRELELEERKRQEQGELEKLRIAQRDKELDLQQKKCSNFSNGVILKDHPKWKKVEMPKFYKSKQSSSKKSRTSENTSQGNSDSAHIGVNLNDEAADSEDVEAQEVPAPIGRDRAKKKGSSSGARSKNTVNWQREPELEERKRQEQGELEKLRIAQRDKELDLQQKMVSSKKRKLIGGDVALSSDVEPVQRKRRKYQEDQQPIKKNDKEFVEPWTIEEEIALCKAFIAKSEDSVQGNGKKTAGFWREVAERFHEEMDEDKRSYDSVNCKWKNRIRPKVSPFCEIYNSVRDRHQSGSCDNTVYQEAELEYRTIYNAL
ncbi:glutathione S-transferase T3-like protein [Tanacetum coccineum]